MTVLIRACTLWWWTAELTELAREAAVFVRVHTLAAPVKRSCLAALAKAATTAEHTAVRTEEEQTTGCLSRVVVAAANSIIAQRGLLRAALLLASTAVSRASCSVRGRQVGNLTNKN